MNTNDIETLKKKWYEYRNDYKTVEIGSGIHSFIKDVLKSNSFFGLKETAKKTNTQNTFVHDTEASASGRPDFILYINNDIIIPCEVKCYTRIIEGENQILRYQTDYDKKYAILTDGHEWRFYNNTAYITFTIEYFFQDINLFITFWNEYIREESYYLSFFENKNTLKIDVEKNRDLFFDDITHVINNFKNKLNLAKFFNGVDNEKKAIEISYAYFIQFILYKTLVDNKYKSYENEFNDRLETISDNLKSGASSYTNILLNIKSISDFISEKLYKPFSHEQQLINDKLKHILSKPKATITDISTWLDIIVFIKKYNFSDVRNDIFGYIYENYLKELYDDSKKGQYFTDPALVNFMLDELGFTKENIKNNFDKNSISIVDPSCGAGTFLYTAVYRIIDAIYDGKKETSVLIENLITENIFGLDIAEFPLYLAEMGILMRMLPIIVNEKYNNPMDKKIQLFKTKDSISEFLNTSITNKKENKKEAPELFDDSVLDLGYDSYIRDETELKGMKISVNPPRTRFDFVIGNPPYISYNDCVRQKMLFIKLIKEKKLSMGNVYGVNLHSVPTRAKKYAPKPNIYAFFISLGIGLLKDGAKMCYIIPQTLLTETDYDVLRYHLLKQTTLIKIVTFAGKMFIGRGLKQKKPVATSSLIFILENKLPNNKHKVKIENYTHYEGKNIDFDIYLKQNKKETTEILQSELLKHFMNLNTIKQSEKFIKLLNKYNNKSDSFSLYYKHTESRIKFSSLFFFDGGFNLDANYITELKQNDNDYTLLEITDSKFSVNLISKFYPKNETLIKIPQGSQGLKCLDMPYILLWNKAFSKQNHFCFLDRQDKSVIIDTKFQFISSDNKNELLYIMSLLNSKINNTIFRKLFSHENEKIGIFVVVKKVKEFIRIPSITDINQFIKYEIIKQTNSLLELENILLKDIIDFSNVSIQKIKKIFVKESKLILETDSNDIKLKIDSNNIDLVENLINKKFNNCENDINLVDLKLSQVIDIKMQIKLKDYIDDLVFALYFDVPIKKIGLNSINDIKVACMENRYYKYLSKL